MGLKSYYSAVQKALSPSAPARNLETSNEALRSFLLSDGDSSGIEKSKKSQTREVVLSRRAGRGLPRQTMGDELSPEILMMMYKMNPAVRTAIDTIVDIVSATKWDIVPINPKQKITPGLESEINRLKTFFTYPNFANEPFRRMLRKWTKDLMLYDAGVFEKGRDPETGSLSELHVAWGGTISIDADPNGIVTEYFQVIPGATQNLVRWAPDELTYSVLYPSSDRVYGMPKLETLHNTITAFLFAEKRNINFFENDARPSGIVNLGQGISEHQLDRFRSYWLAENQGSAHRVMFVGGASSDTKWVPISVNAKDMEMMQYLNWIFKVILMVFGIAPSQVGWTESSSGRTPASAAVLQSAAFKIRVILPILHELSYTLTEDIIRREFNNSELMFKFQEQPTLQERLQKATLNRTLLESKQRTVDEIRQEDGLQPYTEDQKKSLLTPMFGVPTQPAAPAALPGASGAPGAPAIPGAPSPAPEAAPDLREYITKDDLRTAFDDLKKNLEIISGVDLELERTGTESGDIDPESGTEE